MSADDESIPSTSRLGEAERRAHEEAYRARLARYADAYAARHRAPDSLRARVHQVLDDASRHHAAPPADSAH
jgi:hypothetical protein